MKNINLLFAIITILAISLNISCSSEDDTVTTTIVPDCTIEDPGVDFKVSDSLQALCYNDAGDAITCPSSGNFSGQDAQYATLIPSYAVCESVVLDNNTGLMWEQEHHDTRLSYSDACTYCDELDLGGYTDWRIPSIRELFSINQANGNQNEDGAWYLEKTIFDLDYPTDIDLTGTHSLSMMGQTWSSTSRPDNTDINYFYNFLDGHIKSNFNNSPNATLFYRCVRGDATTFATTSYKDNGDETITDNNTGIIWQKANGMQSAGDYQYTWVEALDYCESLELAGETDWKLPDINELQSIVNYEISTADYNSTHKMIDSIFTFTLPSGKNLTDNPTTSPPDGNAIAPFFWSGTTHGDAKSFASYMCFGPCWAVEEFAGTGTFDAHGPGAQRADPKSEPGVWPVSIGDQKDVVQVNNFVRCNRR